MHQAHAETGAQGKRRRFKARRLPAGPRASVSGIAAGPFATECEQMVLPGDDTKITCELINPVAMTVGQRFALREGECMRCQYTALVSD